MTENAQTQLSACIITYNEADRIEACIASLSFCDEIIVVDSHSTDDTRERAIKAGARVIERAWPGYRSQKQFACEVASHDWVLCLDADERVSPLLTEQIIALRKKGFEGADAWKFPRVTEHFGRFLWHGNYPDNVLRLFNRRKGQWSGREIHESVRVKGRVKILSGNLEHYSYRNLSEQLEQYERFALLMAQAMAKEGRKATLWNVIFNPLWCFIRVFLLRAGFLDGWRGLFLAYLQANYVRQKYIKLWLIQQGYPITDEPVRAPKKETIS